MATITNKLNEILTKKKLNIYQLNKLMDFSEGALRKMLKTKSPFSEKAVKKLLPILEVSREEFDSWIVADKYSKEVLQLAVQIKKDFPYKRKSILTTKIDEILRKKSMSRTALSKEIKYSQSSLNEIIVGKRNMSESVRERIATAFELSRDEILAWIVADRYNFPILESAFTVK